MIERKMELILCVTLLDLFILGLCVPFGTAAPGWVKTYGQTQEEFSTASLIQTSDGGYSIIASIRNLTSGGKIGFCIIKTDSSGDMQWNRTYTEMTIEYGLSHVGIQTSDGGYAITGTVDYDPSLIKIDSSGNVQWQQIWNYSIVGYDIPNYALVQTSDGGYAIGGTHGYEDFLLAKTDAAGVLQWSQHVGDTLGWANSMVACNDGGYALAGTYGMGFSFAKTDSFGNTTWSHVYGENEDEKANSVIPTSDGGYALAGDTGSPEFNPDSPNGYLLVKTDSAGNMQWNQTYGGITTEDFAYSVIQTSDGGYAIAGVSENLDFQDAHLWLIKTDSSGDMQWDLKYGPGASANSVIQTSDGGYAIAGSYGYNSLLVRTDANGVIPEYPSFVTMPLFMTLATLAVLVYKRRTAKPR
jgi:hypothetical protein